MRKSKYECFNHFFEQIRAFKDEKTNPFSTVAFSTAIFLLMNGPLQKTGPGELRKCSFWLWQHLYLLESILCILDESLLWAAQALSDLPEHATVWSSTSVSGMHSEKATHTGMSTLPGSPKQCSKVSSSGSRHGDLCLWPYSCISARYYNMATAFSVPSCNALSVPLISFLLLPYPLSKHRD